MKVGRKNLEHLLRATKREQHINSKMQSQVSSCVLAYQDGVVSTTCIVKDGKTSLSRFSFVSNTKGQEDMIIPVPDIDRLLGVLKFHGDCVTLSEDNNKVRVRSKSKQTTLVGGLDSKAYANSQHSLKEHYAMAVKRSQQIDGNEYLLSDGGIVRPFYTMTLPASELYDALRCDGINGQKLNRYIFEADSKNLSVTVGDVFKGMTNTILCEHESKEFSATFEGGLENIFKYYSGDVKLSFLDFTKFGQSISLIRQFSNGDWIFQAGVIDGN